MNEDDLRQIFLSESEDQQEQLNQLFISLENNHSDKKAIDTIFRITHTLKANAAGMGFKDLATLAHVIEDIFSAIKKDRVQLETGLFNDLFRANDVMAAMLRNIKSPKKNPKPKFRGIKTKLDVFLRNLSKKEEEAKIESPDRVTIFEPQKEEPKKEEAPKEQTESESQQSPQNQETKQEEAPIVEEVEEDMDLDVDPNITNNITFSDSIHIPIKKLDNLMNLVGELIIEKDRVVSIGTLINKEGYRNDFVRLQRITSDLQYAVMDVRLVQVGILFNKFHRIARDVANSEGKQVALELEGSDIEIDRNILQIITDSLVHMVRNSISHGIEMEDERINIKKPARGTVLLKAESIKEEVRIIVQDDGKGIDIDKVKKKLLEKKMLDQKEVLLLPDEAAIQYIFEPGFSSADKVTNISGRGVGMNVVKQAVDSVGGKILVETEKNKGSKIILTLPSSMTVKGALLFDLKHTTYAIPLSYTNAVTSIRKRNIRKVNAGLVTNHLDKSIFVVFLADLFSVESISDINNDDMLQRTYDTLPDDAKLDLIIVNYNNREVGLIVDKLYQQKEIVEKSLGVLLKNTHFVSGATILGNGEVCLVLDAPSIMNTLFSNYKIQN